jgi:hypothetical protein
MSRINFLRPFSWCLAVKECFQTVQFYWCSLPASGWLWLHLHSNDYHTLSASEDLDVSELKKKKKSSKKKAAFDLVAFENELQESKSKDANADEEEDVPDGRNLNNINEAELGDDVFNRSEAPAGVDQGTKPLEAIGTIPTKSFSPDFMPPFTLPSQPSLLPLASGTLPSIHHEGNKKSIFATISDICKRMHRQPRTRHTISVRWTGYSWWIGEISNQGSILKANIAMKMC